MYISVDGCWLHKAMYLKSTINGLHDLKQAKCLVCVNFSDMWSSLMQVMSQAHHCALILAIQALSLIC